MNIFKKFNYFFVLLVLIFSFVGCGKSITTETTSEVQNTTSNQVIDREGKEVTLPEKTDKIISLAPSITETLVNLGLSDKLIAVDKYSLAVEGVNQDLPIFDIMSPDAESLVALSPDIIFGTGMSKSNGTDPFAPMLEMGTFVTVIPTSTSIKGITEDIIFIGKATKTEEKANEIVANYLSEIDTIKEKISGVVSDEKIKVYFETSPAPTMYSFGSNVFLNEMLEILNAQNIFIDQEGWNSVSEEQVIEKNPAVIFTNSDFIENPTEEIKNRVGWDVIDAVKNNRVYLINGNSSSRANENSIIAFKEMATFLYPELFN